jgi:hypothetical protein
LSFGSEPDERADFAFLANIFEIDATIEALPFSLGQVRRAGIQILRADAGAAAELARPSHLRPSACIP